MTAVITREDVLWQRLANSKEGEFVIDLLVLSEEFGYKDCIDKFSLAVQEYIKELLRLKESYYTENLYTYIMNVCYVVELYLRGYYNKEKYMGLEQFLNLVNEGKTKMIINEARDVFVLHINRLRKIIAKSKKRIPRENGYFNNTREYLRELDKDLCICLGYPLTSASLPNFYFGRYWGSCGTSLVRKKVGFLNFEKEVYSLYNELYILSKMDEKYISYILKSYLDSVGMDFPYNLFEKVVNNYLFAIPYNENPENLKISQTDAKLILNEIKLDTLEAEELVEEFTQKFGLEGFKAEYMSEYGKYLQARISEVKNCDWFGELFLVTKPAAK